MNISVSAGKGLVPVENGESERIALPMSWYERHRINSGLAVLVIVEGDSMAPAIPDGALVLVQAIENQISQPGVYSFNLDGEAFVTRLIPSDMNGDGRPDTIMVISDNTSFPHYALFGKRPNGLRIVGRIRAVFSTF